MRLTNKTLSELLSIKEKVTRYFEEISNFAQRIEIGLSAAGFPKANGLVAYAKYLSHLSLG